MLQSALLIGAVLVASLGGISDLRSARIPNWLTYGGLLSALAARIALLGWPGLKAGLAGLLVAGIVFFILFVIGAMGGGDVKLMACVGAWVGSSQVLSVLIAAALAGGILALFYVIFIQGIRQTLGNLRDLAQFHAAAGLRPHPALNVGTTRARRVPFGVAIAMGTLFCAGNVLWWR
jgi:prepilin peptidase CpaA